MGSASWCSQRDKNSDGYLMPVGDFEKLLNNNQLNLSVETECGTNLKARLMLLAYHLEEINAMAAMRAMVNLKYGQEPRVQFFMHISDQYSPFYTKVISRVRDSPHVLDGKELTPFPIVTNMRIVSVG